MVDKIILGIFFACLIALFHMGSIKKEKMNKCILGWINISSSLRKLLFPLSKGKTKVHISELINRFLLILIDVGIIIFAFRGYDIRWLIRQYLLWGVADILLLIVLEETFIFFQEHKEMKKEEIDILQYEVVLHESRKWFWFGIVFIVIAILCMLGGVVFPEKILVGIIEFFVFGGIGAGTVLCCKNRCLYLSAKELVYQDFTGKKKKIAYKNISSILSVLDGVCIFEQDCVKEHRINLSRQGKEQLRNYLEGKRFGFLIR